MAILKKDLPALLPLEMRAVAVPELGGDVMLKPLTLSEYLSITLRNGERGQYGHLAQLLAYAIVDAAGEPLYTVDEWERWGGQHPQAALQLFTTAWELVQPNLAAAEKNSTAQLSSSP